MENRLLNIISDILKIGEDELHNALDDRTIWDSLRRVEVLFAVEDEFDVTFDEDELRTLDTPEKLIQAVLERTNEA